MDEFLATPRELPELDSDENGQVVIEWVLVTATVAVPMGFMGPGLVDMLFYYFYRIVGTVALPFP